MIDLFLGLRQVVEDGVQDEEEIAGYRPLCRAFWVLGPCNGYHMYFTHHMYSTQVLSLLGKKDTNGRP
jgi:hypothetical protein